MKVVILEDGLNIAAQMKRNIESYNDQIKVVQILSCVEDAKDYFDDNDLPDLIFSDIELSDGLCFEIFEDMYVNCPIIFTTAFNEYWQKAFSTNSIDYLLKPISKKFSHKLFSLFLLACRLIKELALTEFCPPADQLVRLN
jgi:two-component SAPR family response regulator